MDKPILKDVSLCAIVRDEKINPAGGIKDFIDSTLPYLEAGIIVDTGSCDSTRKILEESKSCYENLSIFDIEFKGFANARNYSLKKIKTKWTFVLDADERLTKEDFKNMEQLVDTNTTESYYFEFLNILPNGVYDKGNGHNIRLFLNKKGFKYKDEEGMGEYLRPYHPRLNSNIEIKHFLYCHPNIKKEWYYTMRNNLFYNKQISAPSKHPNFMRWKELNPNRNAMNYFSNDKFKKFLKIVQKYH